MRNLTVRRNKAYPSSIVKMRVYIEDPTAGYVFINGIPCRMLGELKNGEESTYQIGDYAAKLYLTQEKRGSLVKESFYPIPEGTEDLTVSGKNILDMIKTNPFIFDDIGDPIPPEERKKSVRTGNIVMWTVLLISYIIGRLLFSLPSLTDKADKITFNVENMQITLTEEFKEQSMEGVTKFYNSPIVDVAVSVRRISDFPDRREIVI